MSLICKKCGAEHGEPSRCFDEGFHEYEEQHLERGLVPSVTSEDWPNGTVPKEVKPVFRPAPPQNGTELYNRFVELQMTVNKMERDLLEIKKVLNDWFGFMKL